MEQLTIKELAPYLPYELEVQMNIFGDQETVAKLVGLNFEQVGLDGIRKTVTEWFDFHQVKPILYPLSMLTKDITVDGETFVPMDKIKTASVNEDYFETIEKYLLSPKMFVYQNNHLPVWLNNQLAEWHIDFQGLIEKNLAIDKTTLPQ